MTDTIEVPLLIASATDAQITTASEKAMNEAFFACVEREALILGRGILPASPVLLEFPSKTKIATMIDAASKNLATSRLWAVSTNSAQPALSNSGGQFSLNGDGNSVVMGVNPWGLSSLVWRSSGNDATSNADGGWDKGISPIDPNKTYISVVYVRRTSDATSGTFYHGCHQAYSVYTTPQIVNSSPHFISTPLSKLKKNDWYVSVGFIYGQDVSADPLAAISGMYNLRTGERVVESGFGNYRHDATQTKQSHRSYLYWSTDPNVAVEWWNPVYQEYDGIEPNIFDLSGGILGKSASSGSNTTPAGNLITAPTVSGSAAALAGQSVTLTASGSQYLWGGNTGITYRWTKNGVTTDGATLAVAAGESASVIAIDANGNTSPAVTRAVTVSLNSPPNVTALANTIPSRLTRGTIYAYTLSGATDDIDAASTLQYQLDTAASSGINTLTTVNGTNGKSRGFTVDQNATAVVIVVYVVDTAGLESARVTITRDNSQLDTPILSSGVLSSGTHTVNVPVGNYSITGNGGKGSMYVGTGSCQTDCNEGGCITYCDDNAWYPGSATTIKNGSTLIQSFAGAAGSSLGYNTLPTATTVVKQAAAAMTLTVVVAASGGTCKIDWGM